MTSLKWPPTHPIAQRTVLPAGTPVNIHIFPGATYIIALRGNATGSTITVANFLRDKLTGATDETSGVAMELFADGAESTFLTTGDVLRLTRTHADGVNAPALSISLINAALE